MSKKIVVDPRKAMTKKAFRALQASKRNAWSCARPEGFRLTNRKEYSRQERKAFCREYSCFCIK